MSIFAASVAEALDELSGALLPLSGLLPAGYSPSPSALVRKLQAAEAEVARKVGVFLEPTEIFPVAAPTGAALDQLAGRPWSVEPAYDMPDGFIAQMHFGTLMLLQRPVQAVHSVDIIHPVGGGVAYHLPPEAIKVDSHAGQITLVPRGLSNGLSLSLFTMQALAMGAAVPHMIHVRYTAGLARNDPHLPELQDLVLRIAALRVALDSMPPQSGSISADGLSQSRSQDLAKHQGAIDEELADVRNRILGPVWGVL